MRTVTILLLLSLFGVALSQLTATPKELFMVIKQRAEVLITKGQDVSDSMLIQLDTKEQFIATVAPQLLSSKTDVQWSVVVTSVKLGHTTLFANITDLHDSRSSISLGLVHITVHQSELMAVLSLVCGWLYFMVWAVSLYPQVYENWRRKSVVGFNFDYVTLHQLGHICYSMFNVGLYIIPSIQAEYFRRHPGGTNPVRLNDVVFSLHGTFVTFCTIIQVLMYERGGQSVSITGRTLIIFAVCSLVTLLVMVALGLVMWLDYLYYCSYIKLAVTSTKYIPQIVMNYKLKSTVGFSIGYVLCDITGSVFSMLQMIIISYNCDDWVSIIGDPTKFGLGIFSSMYDIILLVQHYVLYRRRENNIDTKKPEEAAKKQSPS